MLLIDLLAVKKKIKKKKLSQFLRLHLVIKFLEFTEP